MKYKLGFIGAGVMAGAILDRILTNIDTLPVSAEEIGVFDPAVEKLAHFTQKGAAAASSSDEIFENSEIVLLGVKPQFYAEILKNTRKINARALISIMAGVKIDTLKKFLPQIGIARVMPNTPCAIGKGIMGISFSGITEEQKSFITAVLSTGGSVLELAEDKFDALTSISGSGPAYVYYFANALVRAGVEGGLSEEESKLLALATIEGSAAYAAEAEFSLPELVKRVCSKGGTTIEAIDVFDAENLGGTVSKAVKACREKSELLSAKL